MTVEEIEIIVTAKVEEALKEIKKIEQTIRKSTKQVQENFSKIDTKAMTNKLQQAVNFVKNKFQDLRKSSKNNEVAIKINNREASKQISQLEKQINSLQEKINARQMKLNIINPQIDKIVDDTKNNVVPNGISKNDKSMDTVINNTLASNKDFTTLNNQAQKIYTEIEMYNKQLDEAKSKMAKLAQQTAQTATTQNKLGSFFNSFKGKLEQAKNSTKGLKNTFNQLPKITQNVTSNVKKMSMGIKSGIGNVLKYAMALFSLRGIYSVLSGCAQTWLSSQSKGAQQLNANIEYMKYAMGSALAPVIQFVTNLVYQLMRAIQSVAYALTGVNIFATATSMNNIAGEAKKAKNETKQLAGVHNEINNISSNKDTSGGSNSGTIKPNFDLSKMENTPNSIIEAIKNGNWYEVGATIGQKLNDAMNNIQWDKIHYAAKNIGTGIAQSLNGFIEKTNWNQVGNTFAQGLNTIIYFGYNFITKFNWNKFGQSIGQAVNGFFKNIDWEVAAQTLSEGIKGLLDTSYQMMKEIDWQDLARKIEEFIGNIDWSGIVQKLFRNIGTSFGSFSSFFGTLISDAIDSAKEYFQDKIEECGGNIVLGILKGIGDMFLGIGQWIYDNILKPFIDGFKDAFGIHSPSTVMQEQGNFIIEGLFNGLKGIWDKVKSIFEELKTNIGNKFKEIVDKIKEKFSLETIKKHFNDVVEGIKNAFKSIPDWFKNKFSDAWTKVKNVFSSGGKVFDGIKEGILSALKGVINSLISGINKVIKIPFDGINKALQKIRDIDIFGAKPFSGIPSISVPQIPKLAKGNIAYKETLAIFGEYAGASNNPEITTPQNIMRETFEDVLSDFNSSDGQPLHVTIQYLGKEIFDDTIDYINSKTRRTGKNTIVTVGD